MGISRTCLKYSSADWWCHEFSFKVKISVNQFSNSSVFRMSGANPIRRSVKQRPNGFAACNWKKKSMIIINFENATTLREYYLSETVLDIGGERLLRNKSAAWTTAVWSPTALSSPLVTQNSSICAICTHFPPNYIFPRAKFRPEMSRKGPPGCLGMAHLSGWINNETFLASLQHFVKFTKASITNRQLLLLDNDNSHLDFHVVQYCKENRITMLAFPPHCSERIQPFDVSVFDPFKNAMKNSFYLNNTWHQLNPGKQISIHDVAEFYRVPYLQIFTPPPKKTFLGFQECGIFPFNGDTSSTLMLQIAQCVSWFN